MKEISQGNILIVDDDADVLQAAHLFLKNHFEHVVGEKDPDRLPLLLKQQSYDLILLDMNFRKDVTSGQEGFYWLQKIREIDPLAVVVMITAFGDVDMAVRAIKQGATDFVLKPWQNEKLLATISAAINLCQSRRELTKLRIQQAQLSADLDTPFLDFIGKSSAMQRVLATIQKVAATDANILILGENGTGKELVARALHRQSQRSAGVFIAVDMGALTENLFESELFGCLKGAYTDARTDRPGRFEVASGGTLFLDEVGNLPLPLQAKLLRVLESRQVVRLGSNKPLAIDIRLICASNMPLQEMMAHKEFRQDLLYRINTVEIHIPPLRERDDDILLIAEFYLEHFCRRYGKPAKTFSPAARKKLLIYHWPGNVRELKHAVERAVILSESSALQADDIFVRSDDELAVKASQGSFNIEEMEKMVIRQALTKYGGNISQAATELGLTRAALYRRLGKYGLQ